MEMIFLREAIWQKLIRLTGGQVARFKGPEISLDLLINSYLLFDTKKIVSGKIE